jgi:hypothetical protein
MIFIYYLLQARSQSRRPCRILRTEPLLTEIEFVKEVTTGKSGSGDNATSMAHLTQPALCTRNHSSRSKRIRYTRSPTRSSQTLCRFAAPETHTERVSSFNGCYFYQAHAYEITKINKDRKLIYTHLSPPLSAIVEQNQSAKHELVCRSHGKNDRCERI